ncbi:unnamed protein product [Chondrus crispus]|uniref:Uncharacterized protein n=1 Tax=Chondrus crispus TaxID=2769 RepID=R7QTE1_CHOCR|nr:unnamed protein product [Chondrus crispus]CDF41389.1 unnamed protein product [Chondrus crispus]|eukprot:XP_005711683.1 unnamed protein product [Chondrus crispus]
MCISCMLKGHEEQGRKAELNRNAEFRTLISAQPIISKERRPQMSRFKRRH